MNDFSKLRQKIEEQIKFISEDLSCVVGSLQYQIELLPVFYGDKS